MAKERKWRKEEGEVVEIKEREIEDEVAGEGKGRVT